MIDPLWKNAVLSPDGKMITVTIPFKVRRRGGRKQMIAPDGTVLSPAQEEVRPPDSALVKAVARAFRWKKMLDAGGYRSIKELADAEKVSNTYLARLLRLTLLAPDIIEMILDDRLPDGVGLAEFMEPWPMVWEEQRRRLRQLGEGADR